MQLFYSTHIIDNQVVLEKEEARHCSQVLRKKEGDIINVVNGKGDWYECEIDSIAKKECFASILKRVDSYPIDNRQIHIAICPTKNISRYEWFLEKTTEIGIGKITPILTARSERKKIRNDRLEKVLIAAMKQSLKSTLPILDPLISFNDFLANCSSDQHQQKFIAHCGEGERVLLQEKYIKNESVLLLIGPEGDFSKEEIDKAIKIGFEPISLGASRLRTETAGVVACTILNL